MVMIQQWQMADFKLDSRPRSTLASFHSKKTQTKRKARACHCPVIRPPAGPQSVRAVQQTHDTTGKVWQFTFFPTDTCWINIQKDNSPNGWSSLQMTASEDVVHWVCHQEKDYICYYHRLWTLGAFFISARVGPVQHLPVRPKCPVRIASDKIKHQSFFPSYDGHHHGSPHRRQRSHIIFLAKFPHTKRTTERVWNKQKTAEEMMLSFSVNELAVQSCQLWTIMETFVLPQFGFCSV